jgi:hypothetical protein
MNHGNQHASRYGVLMRMLHMARDDLRLGLVGLASYRLAVFWTMHAEAPAGTRRRWKCGR